MDEKIETNWKFLFIMITIEFIIILGVFIIERYLKNKNQKNKEKNQSENEEGLISPQNTVDIEKENRN